MIKNRRILLFIPILIILVSLIAFQLISSPTNRKPSSIETLATLDISLVYEIKDSSTYILIESNEDFIHQANVKGWPGNGSADNPIRIENLYINTSMIWYFPCLIRIENTSVYFEIKDCILIGGHYGIYLSYASNGKILNNVITNVTGTGITCQSASNLSILENIIINCKDGTQFLAIENMTFAKNSIIRNNETGTLIDQCTLCLILNNTFYENGIWGLDLLGENNILIDNLFLNNTYEGLFLNYWSFHNRITQNTFIANNANKWQVKDDGIANQFDNNYWDNWVSPDDNDDGIVDVPYYIAGSGRNVDPFPVVSSKYVEEPTFPHNVLFGFMLLLIFGGYFLILNYWD